MYLSRYVQYCLRELLLQIADDYSLDYYELLKFCEDNLE
jgi:hypothetical protein